MNSNIHDIKFSQKSGNGNATGVCTDTLCTYKTLSAGGQAFYGQQADKID